MFFPRQIFLQLCPGTEKAKILTEATKLSSRDMNGNLFSQIPSDTIWRCPSWTEESGIEKAAWKAA